MNLWLRFTDCGLVLAMLCAAGHAQTPPTVPPATAPASVSVKAMRLARLPDASTTLVSSTRTASQSLHVLVGRSIFVKSVSRLKRVYVSNPEALDSFTSTPTQIVVTAKAPGVSSLILWDEWGESATYLVFSDLDVTNLEKEIRQALPNDNITVQAQQDRVSLSGTVFSEASSEAAVKLAGLYAKSVVNSVVVLQPHTRQVKLKVQIVEIDRSKVDQFGINIFSQGKNTSAVQTGQFASITTAPATTRGRRPLA